MNKKLDLNDLGKALESILVFESKIEMLEYASEQLIGMNYYIELNAPYQDRNKFEVIPNRSKEIEDLRTAIQEFKNLVGILSQLEDELTIEIDHAFHKKIEQSIALLEDVKISNYKIKNQSKVQVTYKSMQSTMTSDPGNAWQRSYESKIITDKRTPDELDIFDIMKSDYTRSILKKQYEGILKEKSNGYPVKDIDYNRYYKDYINGLFNLTTSDFFYETSKERGYRYIKTGLIFLATAGTGVGAIMNVAHIAGGAIAITIGEVAGLSASGVILVVEGGKIASGTDLNGNPLTPEELHSARANFWTSVLTLSLGALKWYNSRKNPKVAIEGSGSFIDGMNVEDAYRYNMWNNYKEAGYKMPWEDYLKFQELATKNPDGLNLTLGKYLTDINGNLLPESYIEQALKNGDTYFDLGNNWGLLKEQYNLTDKQLFDLFNKPVLDQAVMAGKPIRFSQNPLEWGECALLDEWRYLQEAHGFTELEKIGDFWYAK